MGGEDTVGRSLHTALLTVFLRGVVGQRGCG
jgi:hypothetical protein